MTRVLCIRACWISRMNTIVAPAPDFCGLTGTANSHFFLEISNEVKRIKAFEKDMLCMV
jgi:hypothetical protein